MGMTLVGAGFRPELGGLFGGDDGPAVQCAELVADRYFGETGFCRAWELDGLRRNGVPVVIHGLSGNVASALGPTRHYLGQISRLAAATEALFYSDHLALTGTDDRALGHLAPNRFDDELLALAARNIDLMVEVTGRRPRLENLATTIMIGGSTYTPEEFYARLLEVSDKWDCLLDLTNVWINAQNRPLDPIALIDSLPAERIRYIHLAGGQRIDGEWVDTHSHRVHEEVFELLEHLLRRTTPDNIIIERDSNWEGAETEVREDLARVRDIVARAAQSQAVTASVGSR